MIYTLCINLKRGALPVKSLQYPIIICLFSLIFTQNLSAQFGGGGGNRDGGIFSVASPSKSGRIITVGGRLTPIRKIEHSALVSGYVQSILVKTGDRVEPGQALIKITRDVVGETFLPVVVEARIRGIVSEIHIYEKQEVSTGMAALTILDNTSYLLSTTLSDRDARAIRNLGPMDVRGITPEGEEFRGRIQQLSQEPDYNTGLFTLTMEFPGNQDLSLGMVLFVDLTTSKEEGMSIDKTAVFLDGGKSYVWLLNKDNQLTKREIITGGEIDIKITIVSGLTTGERFVQKISGNEKEGISPRDLIQANMGGNSTEGNN